MNDRTDFGCGCLLLIVVNAIIISIWCSNNDSEFKYLLFLLICLASAFMLIICLFHILEEYFHCVGRSRKGLFIRFLVCGDLLLILIGWIGWTVIKNYSWLLTGIKDWWAWLTGCFH